MSQSHAIEKDLRKLGLKVLKFRQRKNYEHLLRLVSCHEIELLAAPRVRLSQNKGVVRLLDEKPYEIYEDDDYKEKLETEFKTMKDSTNGYVKRIEEKLKFLKAFDPETEFSENLKSIKKDFFSKSVSKSALKEELTNEQEKFVLEEENYNGWNWKKVVQLLQENNNI